MRIKKKHKENKGYKQKRMELKSFVIMQLSYIQSSRGGIM